LLIHLDGSFDKYMKKFSAKTRKNRYRGIKRLGELSLSVNRQQRLPSMQLGFDESRNDFRTSQLEVEREAIDLEIAAPGTIAGIQRG